MRYIRHLERRWFWIVFMGPDYNDKCPNKRQREERQSEKWSRSCERGGRDWSSVATSKGVLAAIRSWTR